MCCSSNKIKINMIYSALQDPTTGGSSGMMWLSDDIDLEMMVTKFDLESFGNLVRYTPNVPHHSVEFEV